MTAITRTSILIATLVLLLGVPMASWGDSRDESIAQLELLLAESADTPAEHRALARYYSAKAEGAREQAAHHRSMAKAYRGKLGEKNRMKKHCARLVELSSELATEYEGLASEHKQAADR